MDEDSVLHHILELIDPVWDFEWIYVRTAPTKQDFEKIVYMPLCFFALRYRFIANRNHEVFYFHLLLFSYRNR